MVQKENSLKLQRMEKFLPDGNIAQDAIDLLQSCIRVDTTNPPGNEIVLAELLESWFNQLGSNLISTRIVETGKDRGNLIVIIKGKHPDDNPTYGFASHLDVVPVTEEEWDHPPFGGKVVQLEHDKFVYGRGALDMKTTGVQYAIAIKTLLEEGFQPKGDIKLIFEADEEKGGHEGLEKLVNDHWDLVKVDFLITEGGGFKFPLKDDMVIQIGEKGKAQTALKAKGIFGHGSTPGNYNKFALYELVRVLEKIRKRKPRLFLGPEYKATLDAISLPCVIKALLKIKQFIPSLVSLGGKLMKQDLKKVFIPLISDTIAPTIIRSGNKENVISPNAELTLDIRTLPGHTRPFINQMLERIIGKQLFEELEVIPIDDIDATTTPPGTEFYHQIEETMREIYPGVNLVPVLIVGSTDMRYYRKKGITCYGFVPLLKDEDVTWGELASMSHGPNERVSISNLTLGIEFAYRMMKKI